MKIELKKRIVYAGDVHIALLKAGWSIREAADFVKAIPSVPVTSNADKIRDMTDGELAELFGMNWGCACCPVGIGGTCREGDTCRGAWLNWLQAPAEGGADNGNVCELHPL